VDSDLEALRAEAEQAGADAGTDAIAPPQLSRSSRPTVNHRVPGTFARGVELPLEVSVDEPFDGGVTLHYRHLNQGEDYLTAEMTGGGRTYTASIPAEYTGSASRHLLLHRPRYGGRRLARSRARPDPVQPAVPPRPPAAGGCLMTACSLNPKELSGAQ
jgi:hypothetical protein